jgi:hypothetical protein
VDRPGSHRAAVKSQQFKEGFAGFQEDNFSRENACSGHLSLIHQLHLFSTCDAKRRKWITLCKKVSRRW